MSQCRKEQGIRVETIVSDERCCSESQSLNIVPHNITHSWLDFLKMGGLLGRRCRNTYEATGSEVGSMITVH